MISGHRMAERRTGRTGSALLLATALVLGGCGDGASDDASPSTTPGATATTELDATTGTAVTTRPSDSSVTTSSPTATTDEGDPSEPSEPTTAPPSSTSAPVVGPMDLPPLNLDGVAASDEVTGPEVGSWVDLVPPAHRPCQNAGFETETEVSVWTVVRQGETIGYLVGPTSQEGRIDLIRRAHSACGGGTDDVGSEPQVRSWSTGCEAGSRIVGRWREGIAADEDVFIASTRVAC